MHDTSLHICTVVTKFFITDVTVQEYIKSTPNNKNWAWRYIEKTILRRQIRYDLIYRYRNDTSIFSIYRASLSSHAPVPCRSSINSGSHAKFEFKWYRNTYATTPCIWLPLCRIWSCIYTGKQVNDCCIIPVADVSITTRTNERWFIVMVGDQWRQIYSRALFIDTYLYNQNQ